LYAVIISYVPEKGALVPKNKFTIFMCYNKSSILILGVNNVDEYRKLPEVGNADFDKSDELYQNQVLPCGSSPQAESMLYIIGMPTCK